MAKTYAPQMVKLMQRLNVYVAKHATAITPTLTAAQVTALQSIQQQIVANFNMNTKEVP